MSIFIKIIEKILLLVAYLIPINKNKLGIYFSGNEVAYFKLYDLLKKENFDV